MAPEINVKITERFIIWVDADACPRPVKTLIYRASDRLNIPVVLVANGFLQKPPHPLVSIVQVSKGFDVADNVILESMNSGDLVITQDVPLASEVVARGGYGLNPRGSWYDKESVESYLRRRNEREEMREAGLVRGGPQPFSQRNTQQFARVFDQFLARLNRL
ncbi:MAG: DUF188 domain-containing protein [Gammaproteobacteria bacterium]|nr:DUF188 domain-containing protein [Gammaproteobacteria bacterium]HAN79833.1 YaiI/YqxD family protein [Gammaproteobacteria bacterium]